MEARKNGQVVNDSESLLLRYYKTSDPFKSDAETEYEERMAYNRKKLIEELNRRTAEGSYNV